MLETGCAELKDEDERKRCFEALKELMSEPTPDGSKAIEHQLRSIRDALNNIRP